MESRLQFKVYEGGGRLGSHEATLPNTRAVQFLRLLACDWSIDTNTDFLLVVEGLLGCQSKSVDSSSLLDGFFG